MVLNHSSNQDPHFQAALRDTNSPYRSWYRFSPKPLGNGPWGVPAWHKSPVRDEYYYGIFSAQMPDLNYDTPAVRAGGEEDRRLLAADDGGGRVPARRGAVSGGAGHVPEGLRGHARVPAVVRRRSCDSVDHQAYTIGEVWDPLDTLLTYYPDQLTGYFTFELADSLRTAVKRGTVGGMFVGLREAAARRARRTAGRRC